MDGDAPVGVRDSAVVAVGVAGGVTAGLVPPGLGLPSSGVGLRSSGVGEAEAVAVEVGVGRGRLRHRNCRANDGEQCRSRPNDLGAPAEARDDVAAVGDHGADYRPGAMAADYHPANGRAGLRQARPSLLPTADQDRGRSGRGVWLSPQQEEGDVVSRVRSDPLPARIQLGRRQAELHHGVGGYAVPGPQ